MNDEHKFSFTLGCVIFNMLIRYTVEEHMIAFTVYSEHKKFNDPGASPYLHDVGEGLLYVSGCCDVTFGAGSRLHVCGPDMVELPSIILAEVYKLGPKMKGW